MKFKNYDKIIKGLEQSLNFIDYINIKGIAYIEANIKYLTNAVYNINNNIVD